MTRLFFDSNLLYVWQFWQYPGGMPSVSISVRDEWSRQPFQTVKIHRNKFRWEKKKRKTELDGSKKKKKEKQTFDGSSAWLCLNE